MKTALKTQNFKDGSGIMVIFSLEEAKLLSAYLIAQGYWHQEDPAYPILSALLKALDGN